MARRSEPFTFEAFDPPDSSCTVRVMERRLLSVAKLGHWKLLEARDIVPVVLEHPTVIFQGLRWENDDDKSRPGWRCYCRKPLFEFDKAGNQVKSDPEKVFVVFVNDEKVAYNWRWEYAAETDKEVPRGEDRFSEKIYDARDAA